VCGHYLYNEGHTREARRRLERNIDRHDLLPEPAEAFVKGKVKAAIAFYVSHFRLEGILTAVSLPAAEPGSADSP
jgi:hypothetical protein